MRVNSNNASSMVKEYRNSPTETCTKASTKMASLQVSENITGQMAAILRASSKMAYAMVRESGNAKQEIAINMKVPMKTTKNQDTVSSPGQQATSIKAITKLMCEVATAKCTGRMGAITEGNGKMGSNMARANYMFPDRAQRKVYFRTMCW